jgi:hypothetical protein
MIAYPFITSIPKTQKNTFKLKQNEYHTLKQIFCFFTKIWIELYLYKNW